VETEPVGDFAGASGVRCVPKRAVAFNQTWDITPQTQLLQLVAALGSVWCSAEDRVQDAVLNSVDTLGYLRSCGRTVGSPPAHSLQQQVHSPDSVTIIHAAKLPRHGLRFVLAPGLLPCSHLVHNCTVYPPKLPVRHMPLDGNPLKKTHLQRFRELV
jgi:hypothetical protein